MDWKEKYHLLSKCKDELMCSVCKEMCQTPVVLKKCGHYFCDNCILKTGCCPKCKEVFFHQDVNRINHFDKIRQSVEYYSKLLDILSKSVESVDPMKLDETVNLVDFPFEVNFVDQKSFRKNAKGESKLHLACKRKKIAEVVDLIRENVDINSKDYAGWTPLHEAVQAESVEIVSELVYNNVLINSPGEHYTTPLHKAVLMENIDIVKLLVKNGANKEVIDFFGKKPSDLAKSQNLLEALQTSPTKDIAIPRVYLPIKVVAYCHSIDNEYVHKCKSSKNIQIMQDFCLEKQLITHLIVKKSHKASFKILLSILNGLIIVRQEWIDNFMQGTFILPKELVLENDLLLSKSIKQSLINRLMNKPKLFDGIKFYLEKVDKEVKIHELLVKKDILKLLISAGGGKNLKRAPAPRTLEKVTNFPYHGSPQSSVFGCSNIIIFHEENPPKLQYNMKELKHKSSKWLLDCIFSFKLI